MTYLKYTLVTLGVILVRISQGMVFAFVATSETGMLEPKCSASSPDCFSGASIQNIAKLFGLGIVLQSVT